MEFLVFETEDGDMMCIHLDLDPELGKSREEYIAEEKENGLKFKGSIKFPAEEQDSFQHSLGLLHHLMGMSLNTEDSFGVCVEKLLLAAYKAGRRELRVAGSE